MRDMNEPLGDDMEMDRDSGFHERIQLLKEKGYRGFQVTDTRARWGGVVLSATNHSLKRTLETDGETLEEAYKKMVDLIDQVLDEN